MDNHGITMKGDFKTDNIKSQDGVDVLSIENSTGKTTIKKELVLEHGSPSNGKILSTSDSSGAVEWVNQNPQENLLINSGFDNLVKFGGSNWTEWNPATFYAFYGSIEHQIAPIGWFYNSDANGPNGSRKKLTSSERINFGSNISKFYLEQEFTYGGGKGVILQKLPLLYESAGRTLTFSCWIKLDRLLSNNSTDYIGFGCSRNFGSTSASGSVANNVFESIEDPISNIIPVSGSSIWVHYKKTFNVPSLSGKTVYDETEAALCLWIEGYSSFSSFKFSIYSPKLEWGSSYTGMPVYDKSKESIKAAQFFETINISISDENNGYTLPYIKTEKLVSKKENKNRVDMDVWPSTYVVNSSISASSLTYSHETQQIAYEIVITSIPGGYFYIGEIYINSRFNRYYE